MLQRLVGETTALADAHARRIVDDDHGDVMLRLALLLDQRGVGEDDQEHDERGEAPGEAARPAPQAEGENENRQHGKGDDRRPGQERRGGDAVAGDRHWPSLSRMAGTCTWSVL